MLVLTRKVGERIVINTNIVITVNQIKGTRIVLAIEAPKSVPIIRGELPDRQQATGEVSKVDEVESVFPGCV